MLRKTFYEEMFEDIGLSMFSEKRVREQITFFLALCHLKSGRLLLDMGAGIGLHVNLFNRENICAKGIEYSDIFVKKAKEIHRDDSMVVQGDMQNIQSREQYDAVTFFDTSFGMFSDEANQKLLGNCFNLLKKNGIIFIDYLNPEWWIHQKKPHVWTPYSKEGTSLRRTYSYDKDSCTLTDICEIYEGGKKTRQYPEQHLKLYPREDLESRLCSAGFSEIRFLGSRQWSYTTRDPFLGKDSAFSVAIALK